MFSRRLGYVGPMLKKDQDLFSKGLASVLGDVYMCLMYVEVVLGIVWAKSWQMFSKCVWYFEVTLSPV